MFRCVSRALCTLFYIFALQCIHIILSSEFPERECCDTFYSSLPNPRPVQPTLPTIITQIIPSTISVNNTDCILARQLCYDDPSCSAILEIIPRVCGPIPVACSTVTVTKCLAALKTLQAFPFFRPTCLCKEPGIDPECNNFRDVLFDHPCGLVNKKEKDPYPIDALLTCHHALNVCEKVPKCRDLYENFKKHCKVRDNKCRMEDRSLCYEAWANLRLSPMFGCICPSNDMKKRCDRIFSMVNHNPCVAHSITHNRFADDFLDDTLYHSKITAINSKNTPFMTAHNTFLYPYNLNVTQISPMLDNILSNAGPEMDKHENSPQIISRPHHDSFKLSCDVALSSCKESLSCLSPLQPILEYCNVHACNRNTCMDALQTFYKLISEDTALDIAFCTCKKSTSYYNDACSKARETLHPICAQRPEIMELQTANGISNALNVPECHINAEICRKNPGCRSRLEHFEQACAYDSSTLKCAGRSSNCRSALIGILGTPLRINCSCESSNPVYKCSGWQKLLWMNTCVIESQLDFHSKRFDEMSVIMASRPETYTTTNPTTTTSLVKYSKSPRKITTTMQVRNSFRRPVIITTPTAVYSNKMDKTTEKVLVKANEYLSKPTEIEVSAYVSSTVEADTSEAETTFSTTVTTDPPTTPEPRNCVVQRPRQSDQLIAVNNARRIYSVDDAECSQLCVCTDSLVLSCHALCVPFAPCRTALAFYSHASPAYQAFRGRCLCYSGNFICMRPQPGEYSLPGGIFLLLGYSSIDESLLRSYTNLGIPDTVRAFQQYLQRHIDNQTLCVLSFFNITQENIIITVRLPLGPNTDPVDQFKKEKAQCTSILEQLSYHINTQHTELAAHQLLSVYKMAEVQIISPEMSASFKNQLSITLLLLSALIFLSSHLLLI